MQIPPDSSLPLVSRLARRATLLAIGCVASFSTLSAQDRLATMPGHDRFRDVGKKIQGSVKSGSLSVAWQEDGKSFEYTKDGKRLRFDLTILTTSDAPAPTEKPQVEAGSTKKRAAPGPARGRQFASALSPDGKREAECRDRNVFVHDADGANEIALSTDGDATKRIKLGTASWVYGEELDQRTALWWSPDGTKLAFYRFNESPVLDYYLQMGQTKLQSTMDIEA